MNRFSTLKRVRNTEQGKAENTLDRYFSEMIRERDKDSPCIACGYFHAEYQAGHNRRREILATRWDYRNVNGEGTTCNQGHVRKFGVKDMDLYREHLDERWGEGMSNELYQISKLSKQWTLNEINLLKDACRKGYPVYKQVYDSLLQEWNPLRA